MAEPARARRVGARDLERPLYCLCFNLRRTTRVLTQAYDAALQPAGLTVSQFSVLSVIAVAAPIAMRRLAAWLGMDRTTLTRALRPLERDGLVQIVQGKDRRERRMALTALGRERLKAAMPHWQQAQQQAAAAFGGERGAELLSELADLRRVLGML